MAPRVAKATAVKAMPPKTEKKRVQKEKKRHAARKPQVEKKLQPAKEITYEENVNEPIISIGTSITIAEGVQLEVEDRLGNGSFGQVFKVRRTNYKQCFALKTVRLEKPEEIQRAQEEATLLSYLKECGVSEFVLETYNSFCLEKNDVQVMCFISELLDRSLYDVLDRTRRQAMHPLLVESVGYQMLSALEWLHSNGVTHCDLKPDNVMFVDMRKSTKIKIIDFGLSFYTSELPENCRMQNIMYRAPEVVFGLPLTEKLDIWSVAVMLCEMFTGFDLFPAECEPELARYIEHCVGLPKEVENGAVSTRFTIHDVELERQTVMSFSETQSAGIPDSDYDMKIIEHLDQIPPLGYNCEKGRRVFDQDCSFLTVLKAMLNPNASERIGAKEALSSDFFTWFDGDYSPLILRNQSITPGIPCSFFDLFSSRPPTIADN